MEPASHQPAAPAGGVELFLRTALAREPDPAASSARAADDAPAPHASALTPEGGGAQSWAAAQAALAARFERDLAALARGQRAELARLEARLAAAELAARELASQLRELR